MIIVCRRWKERLKFAVWFIALTWLLYSLLLKVSAWVEPSRKYKAPSGQAVKVFEVQTLANEGTFSERLRFFYWFGGE
jgi:hypothetical protein